jgi:hypothetical protein
LGYYGPQYVGLVVLVFIASLLIIKGFSIDKKIGEIIIPSPPNLIRLFTTAAASIIIGLNSYQTYNNLLDTVGDPTGWPSLIPKVIGWTIFFATNLMVVASCIFLVGIAIYFYFIRDPRIWWSIIGIVATLWMREVSLNASEILLSTHPIPTSLIYNIILVIGLGIATMVITIKVTANLSRRFEHYFKKDEDAQNEKS